MTKHIIAEDLLSYRATPRNFGAAVQHDSGAAMTSEALCEAGVLGVLVVDDEVQVATELVEAIRDKGYIVHMAHSAAAALKILGEHSEIGVLISDIRMPDCDGLELTRRALACRDEATALEVVLITGHATLEDAILAMRAGAFDFVRKPFRISQILDAVTRSAARAMGRRRVATALSAIVEQWDGSAAEAKSSSVAGLLGGSETLLGLWHELRTPLVPILGFAEVLANHPCTRAATVEYAQMINDGGKHLLSTVDDLITLTQIERGEVRLHLKEFSAKVLLQGLVDFHAPAAASMGKSLAVAVPSDITILADGILIRRAVDVLVRIALQRSPRNTTVMLSAPRCGSGAVICVGSEPYTEDMNDLLPTAFAEDVAAQIAPLGTRFSRAVLDLHQGHITLSGEETTAFTAMVVLPNKALKPVMTTEARSGVQW